MFVAHKLYGKLPFPNPVTNHDGHLTQILGVDLSSVIARNCDDNFSSFSFRLLIKKKLETVQPFAKRRKTCEPGAKREKTCSRQITNVEYYKDIQMVLSEEK